MTHKSLEDCHVLVTTTSYGKADPTLKTRLEATVGRVTYNTTGKPFTSEQLQEVLPDVDGYIAGLDSIDADALAVASQLQVIARYGIGVSNVDLDAAEARGIVVTNTPGANSASVAELTIALMLNLLRPIINVSQSTRNGGWVRTQGLSLVGKTVGIVGLGAIGREVAKRLSTFDCHLLACDVQHDTTFANRYNVQYMELDDLLKISDIVSLHVPVLPDTRSMCNSGFIGKMKDSAYLINTARGELVDEDALVDALESGKLAGAALDAFQQEPPDPDHHLLKLPNVIATPHMGGHTISAMNAMGSMALADCLAVLRGEAPTYPVVWS